MEWPVSEVEEEGKVENVHGVADEGDDVTGVVGEGYFCEDEGVGGGQENEMEDKRGVLSLRSHVENVEESHISHHQFETGKELRVSHKVDAQRHRYLPLLAARLIPITLVPFCCIFISVNW